MQSSIPYHSMRFSADIPDQVYQLKLPPLMTETPSVRHTIASNTKRGFRDCKTPGLHALFVKDFVPLSPIFDPANYSVHHHRHPSLFPTVQELGSKGKRHHRQSLSALSNRFPQVGIFHTMELAKKFGFLKTPTPLLVNYQRWPQLPLTAFTPPPPLSPI